MRKKLAESNILIAGLARNCSGVIYSEVLKISNAFSGAKSVRWLIIESDSTDNTVDVLKSMGKKLTQSFCARLNNLFKLQLKVTLTTQK